MLRRGKWKDGHFTIGSLKLNTSICFFVFFIWTPNKGSRLWSKKHCIKLVKCGAATNLSRDCALHPRQTNRDICLSALLKQRTTWCTVWLQHSFVNADSLLAIHETVDCTQTLCSLTFSGLSGEASTKDWEKCTIPTFLFSQNLRHQELGEAFRQSSYSPIWYNTTGRGDKRDREE